MRDGPTPSTALGIALSLSLRARRRSHGRRLFQLPFSPETPLSPPPQAHRSLPIFVNNTGSSFQFKKFKNLLDNSPTSHIKVHFTERPHRLAGPGQRPFTPSTGVQIPLGTPMKTTGYIERCNPFFMRKRLQKRFEKTEVSELPFPASNTLFLFPFHNAFYGKHLRTLQIPKWG